MIKDADCCSRVTYYEKLKNPAGEHASERKTENSNHFWPPPTKPHTKQVIAGAPFHSQHGQRKREASLNCVAVLVETGSAKFSSRVSRSRAYFSAT